MATWGAYFSSYVTKTPNLKQVELEELNEKELLSRGTGAPKRIESISSQKSNSSAKKLYDIFAEPTNKPFERSNSNAARVAKMFGYGTPAPATEVKVEEKVVQSVAPLATWRKIESNVVQPITQLTLEKVEIPLEPVASAVLVPSVEKAEGKRGPGHAPKRSKQDIFAMLDDFANMADNPDSIQILPDPPKEKPVVSEIKVEMKPTIPEVAKENLVSLQKESSSFRSQISPILPRSKLVVPRNPSQSEPSEDFRARMLEFERQSEQLKLEQKRREEEREQMLKYEKMQKQMQYEREKMEIEREKMLEEERRFKEEADRIAEEEKQMEQFMKNFQVEMEWDKENEERKRRVKEEAERGRQRGIDAEEGRIREEKEAEERRRKAQMEAEERRLQAERDREKKEREMKEYEARRAARQREVEGKQLRMRAKDERLAQEEADRLNAKIREAQEAEQRQNAYEEELKADRRRFEEEEERQRIEEEAAEMERQRQYNAEQEAERIRFKQKEADLERQRTRDERIVTQRRVAQERAQRAQFEEDESRRKAQERADRRFSAERRRDQEDESDDDRPLTKEEEMKKAEEKIRQAFAGLAMERDQAAEPLQRSNTVAIQMLRPMQPVNNYPGGITPTGREPEVQRSDRGVSRYNTVGARLQQPKSPGDLRKTPRQPPGGGMGLPGGPRAGLPAGPRRDRTAQK